MCKADFALNTHTATTRESWGEGVPPFGSLGNKRPFLGLLLFVFVFASLRLSYQLSSASISISAT